MEDFLKFLLIAGVILVGIFKEVNKNSKAKKAKAKHPVPPMPSPVEVNPDAVPIPEAWGRPNPWKNCSSRFFASNRSPNNLPNSKLRNRKRKKKKYPLPPLSPTVPHRMNETAGKVPTITLPTIHMTTKKTSPFILLKKPGALLSGEKSFNGSIDKCQV